MLKQLGVNTYLLKFYLQDIKTDTPYEQCMKTCYKALKQLQEELNVYETKLAELKQDAKKNPEKQAEVQKFISDREKQVGEKKVVIEEVRARIKN